MEILIIILAFLFLLAGLIGAFIPVIPGPPLGFIALLLLHWGTETGFSGNFLLTMGISALIIVLLDYYFPIYGTKKLGGSRVGVRGSTIGLLVGLIILPVLGISIGPFGLMGLILCPFLGAWIGERWAGKSPDQATKAAFGSFLGFLAGTFIKFIYSVITFYFFFKKAYEPVFL
ncbi:MAG: DUF456 domain-containing protein [Saprospirales bacterium]|nr:MAG: DUF456 domain-containing protein [Saprospirales bacterium]